MAVGVTCLVCLIMLFLKYDSTQLELIKNVFSYSHQHLGFDLSV